MRLVELHLGRTKKIIFKYTVRIQFIQNTVLVHLHQGLWRVLFRQFECLDNFDRDILILKDL